VRKRLAAGLTAVLAAVVVAACGAADGGTGTSEGTTEVGDGNGDLVVSAASSLTAAFTRYGDEVLYPAPVRFSFAGSDELAAQIRQGVKPDVYAAANTALPDALHEEGLVGRPVVFAANHLVIAVPAQGGHVHALADLSRPGTTIAIGSASVPIGAYTREVLHRLGGGQEQAILANVRSEEPDVTGIVGKLEQGAVDAGFVYLTDVRAAAKRLSAVLLPSRLDPQVAYAAAVVEGAPHPAQARRFIAGLLRGKGLRSMRAAGFELAPDG
jgi:molybdate transport system substrate-binding protein